MIGVPKGLSTALRAAVIVAAMATFFVIATRHIDLPGLYYDEALFYPPAAKLYADCGIQASIRYKIGCVPIVLQPPYLGALKSWLYAGLFSVVDPSPLTIRLPMILLQFASIVLLVLTWAPRMGRAYGLLLFAILCTDTIAIFHARIDWGPYVIANFFKVATLCAAIAWVETGRPTSLVLAGLSMTLGVFDKLNFVWVVGAVSTAFLLVYGREILSAVRASRASRLILLISSATIAGAVLLLASRTLGMQRPAFLHQYGAFDLGNQITRVWSLLVGTLDKAPFGFVFEAPWPGLKLASLVFTVSLVVGLALTLALPVVRARLGHQDPISVKLAYAAVLTLILCFLYVAMVLTKETSGPHHVIVVSLLWPLQVVLCGVALVALADRFAPSLAGAAHVPLAIATAAILLHNLVAAVVFHRALDRGVYGNPNFSPAIYKLAKFIDTHPGPTVASVDWGFGNGLMALIKPGTQGRLRDLWWTFTMIGDGQESPLTPAKIFPKQGSTMFILRPEEIARFKQANLGFAAAVKPGCERSESAIRDKDGGKVIVVVTMPNSCLRTDAP
jgi:hypothetical protein